MLSKTRNLVEALTSAIGPIFREYPDYDTIQQAMGLVLARVAQSTPSKGKEMLELEVMHAYSKQALHELIKLEADKKAIVDKAINGLTDLAAINGEFGGPAADAAAKAQAEEAEQAWNDTLKEEP